MVSSGWNGRTSRKALRGSIATLTSNPHPFSMCFLRLRAHQTHINLIAKLLIRVKVVASGMNLQGCSLTSRSKSISFFLPRLFLSYVVLVIRKTVSMALAEVGS